MKSLIEDLKNSIDHSHLVTEEIEKEWVEMMREEMKTITSFAVPKDHNLISKQFEA